MKSFIIALSCISGTERNQNGSLRLGRRYRVLNPIKRIEAVGQAVIRSPGVESEFETVSTVRETYRGKQNAEWEQRSNVDNVETVTPAIWKRGEDKECW